MAENAAKQRLGAPPARGAMSPKRLVGLLGGVAVLLSVPAPAQSPIVATNLIRPDFWDTDGAVHAIAARDGVVYVGGAFSYVGPRGRKVAAVDAYTADPIREFPAIAGGAVHALVPDQQGGWYLGGEFTRVGAVARTNLVHLRSDFSVDVDFAPDPDGPVRALVLEGSTLFLGGDFRAVAGQPRESLAALQVSDVGSAVLTAWSPGANGSVNALLLAGDTVYVGGRFQQAGGATRRWLAALSRSDNAALAWQPALDGEVLALGLLEDRVVAGGNFDMVGGVSRNGLAAFDRVSAQVDPNWFPNPRDGIGSGGKVTTLRVVCDTVYVGGYFTTIGGTNRTRVAAIDAFTGRATAWNPGLGLFRAETRPSSVQALEVVGDRVFIGGEFNRVQGVDRRDLVAVDAPTGQLLAWNPGVDGGIGAMGVQGRTLLAVFATGPGGVERRNLAAFDEATGRPLDWKPDPNDAVNALALAGNTLYVGGAFTEVAGVARAGLAAVDAGTGALRANWAANANSNVLALVVGDGRLFAGGRFSTVNGLTRQRLAALDLTTGEPIAGWAPPVGVGSVQVNALAWSFGALYLGGSFRQVAGLPHENLAAVNAVTGAVLPWFLDADDTVRTLAPGDGVVYVGGDFLTVGGQERAGLAAVFATGPEAGTVATWNPGEPLDNPVPEYRALAVSGDQVYVGGAFLELGGAMRLGLAAVNADGVLLDWSPGLSAAHVVNAIGVSSRGVYAGGGTGRARPLALEGATEPRFLAEFPQAGAPALLVGPRDEVVNEGGAVTYAVAAAGAPPLSYQWWFNGTLLDGRTNATLTLTNLLAGQTGTYEVRVANPFGQVTSEGSLLVVSPVQLLSVPAAATVAAGSNVVLTVSAIGSPPPIYHWRLNGVLIPGAVYPSLVLSNVSARDGGSYNVVVANRLGAIVTGPVAVRVQADASPFRDQFADRGLIVGASGSVRGSNVGATREDAAGEPRHAGKRGGASVWSRWIAAADGRAAFSTRGSGVDTLLGVYTGNLLGGTLVDVASDEDRGGFLTSRVVFNARAGVEYQIAIDAVGGATGDLVLTWEHLAGVPGLPVITAQPQAQTVTNTGTAIFAVQAQDGDIGGGALQYQWFFGCQAIRGATNATFVLSNVRFRDAGFYHVVVVNETGQVAESQPAALEVGLFPAVHSFEKIEDLFDALANSGGGGGGGGAGFRPAGLVAPIFQLSLGLPITQTFNTSTNGQGALASECGTLSGSAVLFGFTAGQGGRVQIDTVGSSFDTVLAVYRGESILGWETNRLECDNNGVGDTIGSSRVTVSVQAGGNYLARVSGVGGARGLAVARWHLGAPPVIVRSNETVRAMDGGTVTLDAGVVVSNNIATTYQWFFNGQRLVQATNALLRLTDLDAGKSGVYSLVVSNFAGVVTNARAILDVRRVLRLMNPHWSEPGAFAFGVTGHPGDAFVVESAGDLGEGHWSRVWAGTIPMGGDTGPIVDPNPAATTQRYYRVRQATGD